jgi:hypothetical protein
MELGLFAREGKEKLVVACPEGYWKRGNVQIVCGRYGIEVVDSAKELVEGVKKKLRAMRIEGVDGDGKED